MIRLTPRILARNNSLACTQLYPSCGPCPRYVLAAGGRGLAGLGQNNRIKTRRKEAALNSKAESENRASTIRLVLMSDTHGRHRDVEVPDGDLLVHAGDFTFFNGSTFAIRDFKTGWGNYRTGARC